MKNYGDREGWYPSRPYAEVDICVILDMIGKQNSIILFYYSFKIIPSLKTGLKHAYLHRSTIVKFIFDSVHLGLFSSANILQIADVTLRVVFWWFLPCF